MNRFDNPFHDLWITEILDPNGFVKMFSPCVASHAEALFGTGNVVVRGRQGSGKSMLLGLLDTRTRVAYARSREGYPAPDNYRGFLAAGINLTRDNARIVTSRLSERPEEQRRDWAASTFADYVNYLLVKDLLDNVAYLAAEQKKDGALQQELSVHWSESNVQHFVDSIVAADAWYGFLEKCTTFDDIVKQVADRLSRYRRFFNFSTDELDHDIEKSKTDIGEPAAVVADCLRQAGIIPKGALVFLRIDQHEELYELEKSSGYHGVFRQVINRALALRDSRVSYRVGTRHYAWNEQIAVWGSGAHLEDMRDYTIVDIDQMLKRHENASLGFSFGDFAEDVFRRRLNVYGFELEDSYPKGLLAEVFGKTLLPSERAQLYAGDRAPLLDIPDDWAPEWKAALEQLWFEDPLDAKLGEAWLRQREQQRKLVHKNPELATSRPWRDRPYWKKERNEAALIQIAGDANEALVWSGERHIVDLSGWNILAFMSLCRAIWAAWLRDTSDDELRTTHLPKIDSRAQIVGIYEASRAWCDKLKEGADGDNRTKFITALGSWFSQRIRRDKALSNPGHNGISLLQEEFEVHNFITDLIRNCRDNGDLIESAHTTKIPDANPRIKWYLNPLLCPCFRIPHIRTKEPIYTTTDELLKVFDGGTIGVNDEESDDLDNPQARLF
ncbi:hypothetical protein SCD_n00134 [Sulfuricella denitrificans skB26]|uniref:Uncharacterized protein n=1 Tax=Sulfuricella denitrificans (strain DSM 22764 / NBRC 105220 / skB26) TaxID=1163617 RepID=S6AAR2_SULDS|nr:hypothetical protein [Sulfuricella denitrificans]BAN33983.1 hypothetical protein SCD_n00134 [Sulfuricella denitrificans skB26]